MHMAQLWGNLPARAQTMTPGYQGIVNKDIPGVEQLDGAVKLRVIAVTFEGQEGPARKQTPMRVLDVQMQADAKRELPFPYDGLAVCVVLSGDVVVNGPTRATQSQLAVLAQEGAGTTRKATVASHLLVLSGEPIKAPIVGYGPFVMNSREEIIQAIEEFNARRLGQLPV